MPFPLSYFLRILLILLPLAGFSHAAGISSSVTLAWNPNPETNLSGYRVVYGTSVTKLDQSVVVGGVTTAVLNGLESGITYYCAVQAFNTSSLHSDLSPAISFVVPEVEQPVLAVQQGSTGNSLTSGSRINFSTGEGTENLVIRNVGNAALTGLSVTIDGTNAADFVPAPLTVEGIRVGESAPVYIQFRPTSTGSKNAVLRIAGDGLPPFEIVLTGEGVPQPEITVEQPLGLDLQNGRATVHFSHSVIGETGGTEFFTIRNTGTAPLTGLALTSIGAAAADFPFTQPVPASVAPGATGSFQVSFRPSATGIRNATLRLDSNDADESPFEIQLEGNGPNVPEISVTRADSTSLTDAQSTVGFGNVNLGNTGEVQILTITNTGTANITGLSITADGPHIGDFTVGNPGATFLPPGASTTMRVSFEPSAAGTRTGSIHIANNDADENPFDIALSGNGIATPDIAVSRSNQTGLVGGISTISFGSIQLGAAGTAETLTINNTGTAALGGIAISIEGQNPGDFILEAPPVTSLAPSAGTTFKISFRPTAAGTRTATLKLASNDPDENPFIISLNGTAVASPEITITGTGSSNLVDGVTTLALGNVNLGSSGTAQTFTIRNSGTAPLTGLAISTTGHTADFVVTPPSVTTLAPGGTTSFSIFFRPTAAGARAAEVAVASNDADENPFNIRLSGTGFAVPEIAVIRADSTNLGDGSATLTFGSVNLGSSTAAQTLTIRNTGTAFLTGISVSLSGSLPGDFLLTPPAVTSLAPGAATTFGIAFSPGADGARSASIRIASNDADENPFDITLTGTGVAVPVIALEDGTGTALSPGAAVLNFPDILVGSATATETIVVKNTGTAPLTGLTVSLSGSQVGHFNLAAPPATTLAPGTSTSVQVYFSPHAGGGKTASLLIASSATPSAPLVLGLSGNATTAPEISVFSSSTELTSGGGTRGFGKLDIGRASSGMDFTIRNTGSAPLTRISLKSGSRDFIVTPLSLSTLAPGASDTFKVSFKPTEAGTRSTTISLASDDADESQFIIPVNGTGMAVPEITVTASKGRNLVDGKGYVDFGGVKVDASGSQTITIRNTGSAPLRNLSISRFGNNSGDFTISKLSTKSLAPGKSANVRITFNPSKTGIRWGGLRVLSNDRDEKDFDIILSGNGKAKAVTKAGKKKKKKAKLKPTQDNTIAVKTAPPVKGTAVIAGKKYRTLTVTVASGATPSLRDVEVSGDLMEWSSGRQHLTVLHRSATALRVRDNIPITPGNKRYIRLKR